MYIHCPTKIYKCTNTVKSVLYAPRWHICQLTKWKFVLRCGTTSHWCVYMCRGCVCLCVMYLYCFTSEIDTDHYVITDHIHTHVLLFCCLGLGRKPSYTWQSDFEVALQIVRSLSMMQFVGGRKASRNYLSVLMLCAPVFIFTSGSSALLGRPRCGLSIWLSLLAIFNTLFWVYVNLFHEKTDKTWKYSKSAIFVWYENGCRRLLGAQSINTERASSRLSDWIKI